MTRRIKLHDHNFEEIDCVSVELHKALSIENMNSPLTKQIVFYELELNYTLLSAPFGGGNTVIHKIVQRSRCRVSGF